MTKKLLACCLIVALVGLPLPSARADDSDIFGAEIQPNVLIAFDTSGSMDDQIYADPYEAAQTYTGTYVTTKVYKSGYSGTYSVYADSISAVSSATARTALSTVGYWSGRIGGSTVNLYTGNYLNWRATPGASLVKKIDVAKRVLTKLVSNTEGVRFGLMDFTNNSQQGHGGGAIDAPIGSDTTTLTTAINNFSPNGYTPLGEMLRDAGKYFKGLGDYNGNYKTSPIQLDCQPNFVILMSDGLQNGSVDVRTEATNRKTQDHASSLTGTQNVVVSTIGFAVGADEKDAANDVLQTAAKNGGGTFYSTESETQLEAALEDAIRQIMAATFAFATPVIPTTSATGTNRAYLAAFQSDPSRPLWRGYLKAYNRDSSGNVPVDGNGVPLDSALAWEAGANLVAKASADRSIYTHVGGSRVDFSTSTSTTTLTPAMLGVTTSTDRDNLINFIRGVDSYDENGNGSTTEDRAWKLGDIFHSTPVLVTPPLSPTPVSDDGSYAAFKTANAGRTTVLLAGANDGMLHAFRESDGVELWGFIPPNLLGNLKQLTVSGGDHLFFVDGSPVAADVKIGGSWKTVVVFGERRGGRSYHAMDITDPTNPAYLWSFTDTKMGETWSSPIIGKVQMADGTVKFAAFVGGGYDTAQNNNTGKAVFAIDIGAGTKLWEYYKTTGATDDRQYMNFSIPADVTAIDINPVDGYIDGLYVGDVGGQVWKFDLSHPATLASGLVTNWTGKRLFRADTAGANPPAAGEYYPAQGIYSPIIPAYDNQKNLWIYFGTGDRNHPNNTTTPNRFYGIKDSTTMTNGSALTEASLVDLTASSATVTQGFYIRLLAKDPSAPTGSSPTEKVLTAADVFNKLVYFTSFTPTSTSACGSGGGTAKLYAIQMLTGYAALDWAHGAAPLTTTDASVTRSKNIGTGIPSRPVVVITDTGTTITTSVIAATTSQQLPSNPAPPPSSMRRVLYWREMF
jgi:type IV pilus assembly protein PilY1